MTILVVKSFLLFNNIYSFGNTSGLEHLVLMWTIFFLQINDDKNCNYSPLVDLMMNVAAGGEFKQESEHHGYL